MSKWVLDDYHGTTLDYATLGFRASTGNILSATAAPDARWSLNGDQGAAETVTRYTLGIVDPNYVEPGEGHVLAWSDADNAYIPTDLSTAVVTSIDPTTATNIEDLGSDTDIALRGIYALADGSTDAYVPRATLVLPNPCYIAHRGGAGYAPEETMEAYRTSIACGVDGVESDCQPLADGALGLMHDSTVDRTTDGTGTVASFTAPSFRALNAADAFPWNGKVVPPALLTEALNEFGGSVVFMIEPKDVSNAGQIMDLCDRQSLKGSVILATADRTTLIAIKARGYSAYFFWSTTTTSPALATIVADGADYLGISGTSGAATDLVIAAMVATGVPVIPYTINRRVDKARLLGLGCEGFLGDQPVYLKATTAMRTIDSWRQGVLGHGLLFHQNTPQVVAGAVRINHAGAAIAIIPGEVLPIANAAGSYVIDIDCGYVTMPADTTRAISVSFGIVDDTAYSHAGGGGPATFPNEYRAYLRANGTMNLYSVVTGNGGTFTTLGTTPVTDALTAGSFAHLRITVTPTTVRLQRTDGTAGDTGTVTNNTQRGAYIILSKNATDADAQFKNLAIT